MSVSKLHLYKLSKFSLLCVHSRLLTSNWKTVLNKLKYNSKFISVNMFNVFLPLWQPILMKILTCVMKMCKIIIICIIKSFLSTPYFICISRSQIGFLFPRTFKFSSVHPRNTVWSPYWESPPRGIYSHQAPQFLGTLGCLLLSSSRRDPLPFSRSLLCRRTDWHLRFPSCFVSWSEQVSQRALLPQKWVNEDMSIIEDNNIMSFDKKMPFLKESWNQQALNSSEWAGFQNAEGYTIKVG